MVRANVDALAKERSKLTTKKTDDYKLLNDQVESLKHRKDNLNQNYSSRSFQQRPPSLLSRPSSGDQRRHRSDHLLPTASSHNRSKYRSNSNDSRRSGSEICHHSSSVTARSPSHPYHD